MAEHQVYGPPGTGKTTYLSRKIRSAAQAFGGQVLVASFTRTAAAELVHRNLPLDKDRVGTLHSFAYRALGCPELAETKEGLEEWNAAVPDGLRLSGSARLTVDEPLMGGDSVDSADRMLASWTALRASGKIPAGEEDPTRWAMGKTKAFAARWEAWKRESGRRDFQDLIEECLRTRIPCPVSFAVSVWDEVQDFTPSELALARQWSENATHAIFAGDDDQCSVQGTLVLTEKGIQIPIEELDPDQHRLVCFRRHADRKGSGLGVLLEGLHEGFAFEINKRAYSGPLVSVHAGDRTTTTTPDHLWFVRWTSEAWGKGAVYLLRKDSRYQIGASLLFRRDGVFYPRIQAVKNRADAMWILRVCDDRDTARRWAEVLSMQYSIPTVVFVAREREKWDQHAIKFIYDALGDDLKRRAMQCLLDHGQSNNLPFWKKGAWLTRFRDRGNPHSRTLHACNLLDHLMEVPVRTGRRIVEWYPVTTTRSTPEHPTEVYSIGVEPHHTYVADNIVTHNCLYGFRGANPSAFLRPDLPEEQIVYLTKTWRLPRTVLDESMSLVRRIKTRKLKPPVTPRCEGGRITRGLGSMIEVPSIVQSFLIHGVQSLRRGGGTFCRGGGTEVTPPLQKIAPPLDQDDPHGLPDAQEGDDPDSKNDLMILASCGYMLDPVVQELRTRGVRYHNPYRPKDRRWNPSTERVDGLRNAYRVGTTWPEAWRWVEALDASKLPRGAKTQCQEYAGMKDLAKYPITIHDVCQTLGIEVPDEQVALDWFEQACLASWKKRVEYGLRCARNDETMGPTTRVIVGTIHSVKGGQADHVILCPDLSRAAWEPWARGERDPVLRMMYVGMTRARQTVSILDPGDATKRVPL